MSWGSAITMGVQNFFGGLEQYASAQSTAETAERNAKIAALEAQAQASAYNAQAKVASIQAAQAQKQGEAEENKRSRLYAQDIGSVYAQAAGNGLLVDAGNDTVGSVLTSVANEAESDINTIRDNTRMNVWTYDETAKAYRKSAANALAVGQAKVSAYNAQANAAYAAGNQGLMQTISGIPSTVWSTAGVKDWSTFGLAMGGTATPVGTASLAYGFS